MGQLSDKLLENNIYSIFAVEKQQYRWYEVMSPTHVHTTIQAYAHTLCVSEKTNVSVHVVALRIQ